MAPNIEKTPQATHTINAEPIDPVCSITPFKLIIFIIFNILEYYI